MHDGLIPKHKNVPIPLKKQGRAVFVKETKTGFA
jgi:hypothetical protein